MRLLYVLRYWPTRSETFVASEIAELRRRGHTVVVFSLGSRADGAGLDPVPGLEVWSAPRGWRRLGTARGLAASVLSGEMGPTGRLKDAAVRAWVVRRAVAWGVQRIHAHFAGEAAQWAQAVAADCGVPYSVTVHANGLFRPRAGLSEVLQGASPVVTVCEHHRQWMKDRLDVSAVVVRCGVDLERFISATPSRPPDDRPLELVCVARWVPKKGLDELLAVVQNVDIPIRLRLVSDAPGWVSSERVRVGPVTPAEVPRVLAEADCFVLPCRIADDGDRDGVPVALMEAMAAGLPVVSTRVSGIPELVDDEVGWLVPADDPGALEAAIRAAAADPAARESRGRKGRDRIEQGWTLAQQVDGLCRAWGLR